MSMILPTQDINPAANLSQKIVGERYGKDARDRYAVASKTTHFGYGNSRKSLRCQTHCI